MTDRLTVRHVVGGLHPEQGRKQRSCSVTINGVCYQQAQCTRTVGRLRCSKQVRSKTAITQSAKDTTAKVYLSRPIWPKDTANKPQGSKQSCCAGAVQHASMRGGFAVLLHQVSASGESMHEVGRCSL